MKKITVFTSTFNRAYCLHQLYESLIRQTNKDFIWLIIDDGSTDNTILLVNEWIENGHFEIKYVYKENEGMHTGYNMAYELIETELNVCIDSDDFMTDDAIEKILKFWKEKGNPNFAGIVALDATKDGKILGKKFPENLTSSTLEDLYHKHKISGDKKLVYNTSIVKNYPKHPVFKGEKFVPLGTLYLQIDKDFELLCLHEVVCIVEYMEDGSTKNIFNQYVINPEGFRYSRLIEIKYSNFFKVRFKGLIHYISSSIFMNDYNFFKSGSNYLLTVIAIPLGILLNYYIRFRNK